VSFKKIEFQLIIDKLGLPIKADLLCHVTENYLIDKANWDDNPNPSHSKPFFRKLRDKSKDLATPLEHLDSDRYFTLKSNYENFDNFRIELFRFQNTTEEILNNIPGTSKANYPFSCYLKQLKTIYEEATGEEATVTYDPGQNKSSKFLQFVYACLLSVDPQAI